ncbi:MAG: glycosyltransferase family 4 protein [Christensenellaceae bacterium]|jgi:glycosyltransferase involved in cell wall biosynthesis|nr:glycosyltransferase family 4 protein [Christensenellaceae bacterium]
MTDEISNIKPSDADTSKVSQVSAETIGNNPFGLKASKILIVTTTDSMIWHFLVPHIKSMLTNGCIVECACSKTGFYFDNLKSSLKIKIHELHFNRHPLRLQNLTAFIELKKLIRQNNYDILHCHEPVGGAISRLAGHKYCKRIVYTAHGFHFFEGNSSLNNFLYKNIERYLAKKTDMLITMNEEDYRAAASFKLRSNSSLVYKINGIGIDTDSFNNPKLDKLEFCKTFNIDQSKKILLSVGECIPRKNHLVLIKAMEQIDENAILLICGCGILYNQLIAFANKSNACDRIFFMGFQKEMFSIYTSADVFVTSSLQEGLPCSVMEAMASKLPVVASKIRGHVDLIDDSGGFLIDPNDVCAFADSINTLLHNPVLASEMGMHNKEKIKMYDTSFVLNEMKLFYSKLMECVK